VGATQFNRGAWFGRPQGFALIALLIFVLIVGVVASFAIELGSVAHRRQSEQQLLYIGGEYQHALQRYYDATPPGRSPFPDRLEDLLLDPRYPDTRRYLRRVFSDPISGRANWVIVQASSGGILGIHSRSEETPIKLKGFELQFKQFETAKTYQDWIFYSYPQPSFSIPPSSSGITTN
jgi:type II secretory pathway pseudopilin PulG